MTDPLPFHGRAPDGREISVNSRHLVLDGRPWLPVTGEFHYARLPETEWRDELLKLKAGGIDIVATYVFWIHHEEIENAWDWSGCRDLRRFATLCHDAGLFLSVRCGPWCHGETRNGGFPDWLLAKGWQLRTDAPAYLDATRRLYAQIARQLRGLLWRDGGPVIGIQVENEYAGPAQHLVTLKRLAFEAGLDVPLPTRTGWPPLETPMPFGELLPLFGAYPEGFWDREITAMPSAYRSGFHFLRKRTNEAIANERLTTRQANDEADVDRYPYLTCELAGGMTSAYHRRIRLERADITAMVLTRLGSGGNMPGYYVFHGGRNPDGRLSTLQESQDSPYSNYNDLPVKNYDFFAPLGQYNQVRPHYHWLRRLHLWLGDSGSRLAELPARFPSGEAPAPGRREDTDTLRWSERCDARGGYIFVNNHHRGLALPEKRGVRFTIKPDGDNGITFPSRPVTVPAGAQFIWPFGLDAGHGVTIDFASAQPVCRIDDPSAGATTRFFASTSGIQPEFSIGGQVTVLSPGREVAMETRGADGGLVRIVLLDDADSLALWKGVWRGHECAVLCRDQVIFDRGKIRVIRDAWSPENELLLFAPGAAAGDFASAGLAVCGTAGVFTRISLLPSPLPLLPPLPPVSLASTQLRAAGPARVVPVSPHGASSVAEAPGDSDFANAALWSIRIPDTHDLASDSLLRLEYRGDVARVFVGGKLVRDDFYNGAPLEIGIARHARELEQAGRELHLAVLPLHADAPVFLPEDVRASLSGETAGLTSVTLGIRTHHEL
jgi:hypothetical protein